MHSHLGSRSVAWVVGVASALCALAVALAVASPAHAQAGACLYPGADQFNGTSLDTATRWKNTLRHDASLYTVADGKAKVQTGAGEIQTTAPNIFLQPVPTGTWEVTTKVKIDHTAEGQQAGLLLTDPTGQNLVKLAYVQKGPADGDNKWIEFLKIVGGEYDFSGTWHSTPSKDYPDELWLRYRSDGETLSGFFSTDGTTWQPAGDPRNYEAITNPQVGFYALRGGAEKPVITAEFDNFNLVPADDEFDGTAIDECRWTEIFNRNDAGMSVGDGVLTLRTLQGELSGDQAGVQNMLLQPTNDSDWQATTKVTMTPTAAGQQAGLVIWGENEDPTKANYVKLVFVRKNANATNNAWIEFLKTTDGVTDLSADETRWNSGLGNYGPTVYLRLVSAGGQLSAYWSRDGETFTKVGVTHPTTGIENPQVGVMALKGTDAAKPEVDAEFDWFRMAPSEGEPPAEAPDCTTQAEPETGFNSIFDGTQASFNQWKHAGGGTFTLNQDGSMTSTNTAQDPGLGLHWYEPKAYKNFSLRMQWKTGAVTDNSGVFVRFPNPGTDVNIPIAQGHEIQIHDNPAGSEPQKTGSIYNADRENFRTSKPSGEWNDYEITVVGQKYTVCLNGKVVNEYTSNQGRPLQGYIGVQNHDPNSKVSFRNIRVKELDDVPPVQNLFDTIGITNIDNRANAGIHGTPSKYAYIAEQMPPSRSVGAPGDDTHDDVPVRMPDTRGVTPNLASFSGQEYFVSPAQQKAYSKIHFFGATTDASNNQPSGGNVTLTFADGTTEQVVVRFRDWANTGGDESDHVAIRTNPRYTTTGTQGNIDFNIFHKPITVSAANRNKVLVSIKLPPNSTPGNANTRAYLMAMTFEDATGGFEMPILAGNSQFPNDQTPPVTTATVDPATPDGSDGWYKRNVAVSLTAADEQGGSQVDTIEYRVGGGAWLPYEDEPVLVDVDGNHSFQFRSMDQAGNLETQKSVALKIDSTLPEIEADVTPALPVGGTWHDQAATLVLDGFDGYGSGIAKREYAVDGGAWQEYTGPVEFTEDGSYEVAYRAVDKAGNTSAAGDPVMVQVDRTAPQTSVLLNGAAPLGNYSSAVKVELSGTDGAGSGVAVTEYRVDGGAWTAYDGAFSVDGAGLHRVEFRSVDAAGNPEPTGSVAFNRIAPSGPPPGGELPAPKPEPWAALGAVRRSLSSVAAFRRGRLAVTVSCQSVERGTLRLTVSRKVAKRLGLKSTTLAKATVRCGDDAEQTVRLKPSKKVKKALAGKGKSVKAKLSVRLTGSAGSASDSARLTLRR